MILNKCAAGGRAPRCVPGAPPGTIAIYYLAAVRIHRRTNDPTENGKRRAVGPCCRPTVRGANSNCCVFVGGLSGSVWLSGPKPTRFSVGGADWLLLGGPPRVVFDRKWLARRRFFRLATPDSPVFIFKILGGRSAAGIVP